jgi:glutamate formiminotransferase/formiminotetrahydrofolate cyclodeaminase
VPGHFPDYINLPIQRYLTDAAGTDSPAGGATAALCGALASALGQMAASLMTELNPPEDPEDGIERRLSSLARCQKMFERLLIEDMEAFETFMDAWKLSKHAPAKKEKMKRGAALSVAVPSEIVAAALVVLSEIDELLKRCGPNAVCDAVAGSILAEAVARAAAVNVLSNLSQIEDQERADHSRRDLEDQLARARDFLQRADSCFARIIDGQP